MSVVEVEPVAPVPPVLPPIDSSPEPAIIATNAMQIMMMTAFTHGGV